MNETELNAVKFIKLSPLSGREKSVETHMNIWRVLWKSANGFFPTDFTFSPRTKIRPEKFQNIPAENFPSWKSGFNIFFSFPYSWKRSMIHLVNDWVSYKNCKKKRKINWKAIRFLFSNSLILQIKIKRETEISSDVRYL